MSIISIKEAIKSKLQKAHPLLSKSGQQSLFLRTREERKKQLELRKLERKTPRDKFSALFDGGGSRQNLMDRYHIPIDSPSPGTLDLASKKESSFPSFRDPNKMMNGASISDNSNNSNRNSSLYAGFGTKFSFQKGGRFKAFNQKNEEDDLFDSDGLILQKVDHSSEFIRYSPKSKHKSQDFGIQDDHQHLGEKTKSYLDDEKENDPNIGNIPYDLSKQKKVPSFKELLAEKAAQVINKGLQSQNDRFNPLIRNKSIDIPQIRSMVNIANLPGNISSNKKSEHFENLIKRKLGQPQNSRIPQMQSIAECRDSTGSNPTPGNIAPKPQPHPLHLDSPIAKNLRLDLAQLCNSSVVNLLSMSSKKNRISTPQENKFIDAFNGEIFRSHQDSSKKPKFGLVDSFKFDRGNITTAGQRERNSSNNRASKNGVISRVSSHKRFEFFKRAFHHDLEEKNICGSATKRSIDSNQNDASSCYDLTCYLRQLSSKRKKTISQTDNSPDKLCGSAKKKLNFTPSDKGRKKRNRSNSRKNSSGKRDSAKSNPMISKSLRHKKNLNLAIDQLPLSRISGEQNTMMYRGGSYLENYKAARKNNLMTTRSTRNFTKDPTMTKIDRSKLMKMNQNLHTVKISKEAQKLKLNMESLQEDSAHGSKVPNSRTKTSKETRDFEESLLVASSKHCRPGSQIFLRAGAGKGAAGNQHPRNFSACNIKIDIDKFTKTMIDSVKGKSGALLR